MKILHLVRQFAPAIGGLESYVKDLCLYQRNLGVQADVLTLHRVFHGQEAILPAREVIDGIDVHRIGFIGHRRYFLPFLKLSLLKQYDIIHVHNTDMLFDCTALLRPLLRRPLIATTHGGFFHTQTLSGFKKLYFNVITRMTANQYQRIFAISQNDYDTFAKIYPISRMLLQPNAIRPLGTTLSHGDDFMYIGRLAQHKHVERVIAVFAELKKRYQVKGMLHIAGPAWDVTIESLETQAKALGIQDSVILHGRVTDDQMQQIAAESRYFLSASTFEGFGMSMLEGMSVGMIPYVEANQSFSELVAQSGIGLCLDYSNTEEAAADIAASLSRITEQDRQTAQSFAAKFDWNALAEKTLDVYKEILH